MRRLALLLPPLLLAACGRVGQLEVEPATVRFASTGSSAGVRASMWAASGKPLPRTACEWSTSDEKVATVAGRHNEAIITAVGPGSARVLCSAGGKSAAVEVTVRVVARVEISPSRADLTLADEPRPFALEVRAFDDRGAPVTGRVAQVTCADEEVCRGDARGQLWGTGPGTTTATVKVEGATATLPVNVKDARSADARPRAVKGNPMEELEREVRAREARERAAGARP